MATVLYIDMYGFKEIIAEEDSRVKIDQLDQILVEFDVISDKHKLQKIRTIGDNYMAVVGAPRINVDASVLMAKFALNISSYLKNNVEQLKQQ